MWAKPNAGIAGRCDDDSRGSILARSEAESFSPRYPISVRTELVEVPVHPEPVEGTELVEVPSHLGAGGFDKLSSFDGLRTRGGFDKLSPNGFWCARGKTLSLSAHRDVRPSPDAYI